MMTIVRHIIFIFVMGIVGGHGPMTRRFPTFLLSHFSIVGQTKKLNDMTRRKDFSVVIADFDKAHNGKYDYSMAKPEMYKNNGSKLPIICPKHGLFWQVAASHLSGSGCPQCANEATGNRCRMTYNEFITRARNIHGDKYTYNITEFDFADSHQKISITCPIHGNFEQSPHEHLSGRGCRKCGKNSMAQKQRFTKAELIKIFDEIFDHKYDYSLFNESTYQRKKDKIDVICPKHGVFRVSVNNHLYNHSGCPKCKRSKGEESIADVLHRLGIEFKEQYNIRNEFLLCTNETLMVDFYLPKHKAIIEFQGIQHYKEIPFFNCRTLDEQKERDCAIRFYCKQHKLKLIEIPYTEMDNIETILKSKLKT